MNIIGIDDRSEPDGDPAGFIIFSGLARLHCTFLPNPTGIGEGRWHLGGPGTTTWPPVTDAHRDLALAHLKQHGLKVPDDAAA